MIGELLVVFNTMMNVLLLKFTVVITGLRVSRGRLWLSAFCSALLTVIFPPTFWSLIISFICLLGIAFSWRWSTLVIQGSWLLVGTLLVGGFLTLLQPLFFRQSSTLVLILLIFLASCLLFIVSKGWQRKLLGAAQQAYMTTCEFLVDEMKLSVRAYIDTGNECREPLSGAPVHFLSFQSVRERMPEDFCLALQQWQASDPTNLTMFSQTTRRLIRFVRVATIQNEPQLVLAFRATQLVVDGCEYAGHYIVFTQNEAPFPQQADLILHVCILLTK